MTYVGPSAGIGPASRAGGRTGPSKDPALQNYGPAVVSWPEKTFFSASALSISKFD